MIPAGKAYRSTYNNNKTSHTFKVRRWSLKLDNILDPLLSKSLIPLSAFWRFVLCCRAWSIIIDVSPLFWKQQINEASKYYCIFQQHSDNWQPLKFWEKNGQYIALFAAISRNYNDSPRPVLLAVQLLKGFSKIFSWWWVIQYYVKWGMTSYRCYGNSDLDKTYLI